MCQAEFVLALHGVRQLSGVVAGRITVKTSFAGSVQREARVNGATDKGCWLAHQLPNDRNQFVDEVKRAQQR